MDDRPRSRSKSGAAGCAVIGVADRTAVVIKSGVTDVLLSESAVTLSFAGESGYAVFCGHVPR